MYFFNHLLLTFDGLRVGRPIPRLRPSIKGVLPCLFSPFLRPRAGIKGICLQVNTTSPPANRINKKLDPLFLIDVKMLLIIPTNNVTVMDRSISAGPLNNFGFDLNTETGAHIEWQLYLFLATYVGTGNRGLQA